MATALATVRTTTTRRDAAPRQFDSVVSPRRGAQSRDAETNKTRTRRRIMASRVKERGPQSVATTLATMRTTTTRRKCQRIAVIIFMIKNRAIFIGRIDCHALCPTTLPLSRRRYVGFGRI